MVNRKYRQCESPKMITYMLLNIEIKIKKSNLVHFSNSWALFCVLVLSCKFIDAKLRRWKSNTMSTKHRHIGIVTVSMAAFRGLDTPYKFCKESTVLIFILHKLSSNNKKNSLNWQEMMSFKKKSVVRIVTLESHRLLIFTKTKGGGSFRFNSAFFSFLLFQDFSGAVTATSANCSKCFPLWAAPPFPLWIEFGLWKKVVHQPHTQK